MTQPMSLTMQNTTDESRILLAEVTTSASFYVDADLYFFYNEGLHDMCVNGLIFEKTATVAVSALDYFTLPEDWIRSRTLLNDSGNALRPINPSDRGRYYGAAGTPLYYWEWGLNIWMQPKYSGAGVNYTLFYYALDATIAAGGSTPNIRSTYHRALIPFVCMRALMKARQFKDAEAFAQDYARMTGLSVDRLVDRFPKDYAVSGIPPKIDSQGSKIVPQNP